MATDRERHLEAIALTRSILANLTAATARGEISGVQCVQLETKYTELLRKLKAEFKKKFPFFRRKDEQSVPKRDDHTTGTGIASYDPAKFRSVQVGSASVPSELYHRGRF